MKPIITALLACALVLPASVHSAKKTNKAPQKAERPAVCIWDYEHMLKARKDLATNENSIYKRSLSSLLQNADKYMQAPVIAITDKPDECTAPTGDKRDFMSVGDYSWPNPDTPDGMPWIRWDGHWNPNAQRFDLKARLQPMTAAVSTLGLAYFYTGNEEYARKAAEYARAWFVTPSTRMNPHMTYAACLPGHNDGKGYYYGLIQGTSFRDCLAGLCLIKGSKAYTAEIDSGVKQWAREMSEWLFTSDMGKRERAMKNNHAMAYYIQVISYAMFLGNTETVSEITKEIREKVISKQIEPDGRQPQELRRPAAYNYTLLNLQFMVATCTLVRDIDPTLFDYVSSDGRSISKGLDFAMKYLGKTLEDFAPYREDAGWEGRQKTALWLCAAAAPFDPSGKYKSLFEAHKALDSDESVNYLKYSGK